jgi:hypothetical protein
MVNKAGLLCGLILVLLVFICYLFTSVDLGQLQKNLQQWTKTKISYIHDEDTNENKGVINKDINLVGPSTHQNRTDNPSENSTVTNLSPPLIWKIQSRRRDQTSISL